MATKKTKPFEILVLMDADANGETETIDLNQYVQVADMEAFGIMNIEVGFDADGDIAGNPSFIGNKLQVQVALSNLGDGFITHASYDSLFLHQQDGTTGFVSNSLSLGDTSGVRYVPGGLIDARAYATTSSPIYVRLEGVVSKLSDKDYLSLVMTARGEQ